MTPTYDSAYINGGHRMTMTTRVYALDPVNGASLHAEATRLVNPTDQEVITEDDRTGSFYTYVDGRAQLRNTADQGLAALVWTHFGVDHPITDREIESDGTIIGPDLDFMAMVAFDTPYGASEHHAWLVAQLGEWLDDRGVRWVWELEYDGSLHKADDLHLLGDIDHAIERSAA